MGVVISTSSTLAPISFASSIIGFVSFAFTLATFLKVVWVNLETLAESQHNVHRILNNLREELLEERASLKVARRANKQRKKSKRKLPESIQELVDVELDDVTLKTMSDTVRWLMRRFRDLERPFLQDGEDGIEQARRRPSRRRADLSPSPHYDHPAYEKRGRAESRAHEHESDDEMFWAQRVQYAPYTFSRRLGWLYNKAEAQDLLGVLSRIQTRRIARQINSVSLQLRGYGDCTMQCDDALARIEDRLNRVIGVRRIE